MQTSLLSQALCCALAIGLPCAAGAQAALPGDQQEADNRVIAARCGTPAFEKAFYKQSRAAVAAGLVVPHRDPALVEKSITALRRNPVVLVGAQSDCPEQLARLRSIQKERAKALGGGRRSSAPR